MGDLANLNWNLGIIIILIANSHWTLAVDNIQQTSGEGRESLSLSTMRFLPVANCYESWNYKFGLFFNPFQGKQN